VAASGSNDIESWKRRFTELFVSKGRIDIEYQIREGEPSSEILRMAHEAGVDVIVMGTHGRTGLRRLLAGSVAASVLREARCPVMALHSHQGRCLSNNIQVILHPIAISARWEYTLRSACMLAANLNARLVIVHISPRSVLIDGSLTPQIESRFYQPFLEEARKQVEGSGLKYPADIRLSWGNVTDEILSMAKQVGCDLIVMGTHARSCPGHLLMGSVAESVLHRTNYPVLLIKARDQEPSALSEWLSTRFLHEIQPDEG